jgi:hypothetical protein
MQSWPSDTCEGAFMKNPANSSIVQAIAYIAGD